MIWNVYNLSNNKKKKTMKKDRKTVSYMIYNIQADRYLTRVDR